MNDIEPNARERLRYGIFKPTVSNSPNISFTKLAKPTGDAQALAADFKARARAYGRTVRVVCMVLTVWAVTRAAACAERERVIEQMDPVAVRNWAAGVGMESGSFDQQTLETFAFGAGSLPLLGTADDVAEQIAELYRRGMDGVLMSYMDFLGDTRRFGAELVPRLRSMPVL